MLDVEDEVRESRQRPRAQLGHVELVGEAQRATERLASNTTECALDGVDEASGVASRCLGEEVVDGGLDVVGGKPAQSDWLGHDSGVGLDAVAQRCEVRLIGDRPRLRGGAGERSEEHTSELQSLMRNSYAVFC